MESEKKKETIKNLVLDVLLIAIVIVASCVYYGWKNDIHSINQYLSRCYVNKAINAYNKDDFKACRSEIIDYLNKAIELDDEYWEAWFRKGCIYVYDAYNLDTSLICFQRSLQLMEEHSDAEAKKDCYWFITFCQLEKKQWSNAVNILQEGMREYPDFRDLQTLSIELSKEMLESSGDTTAMWELSEIIWDIDRKCGLNLRRKCARLGNKQAQDWFIMKNYEWD